MENVKKLDKYGIESFGRLKKVMLHKPSETLDRVFQDNFNMFTNGIPDTNKYLEEHDEYEKLLVKYGVEVLHLCDYIHENTEIMNNHQTITCLHDSSVITSKGAILSKMCHPGRLGEEIAIKEALTNLGIPIFFEFSGDDRFEGCLLLSPQTIFIANTERHTKESIERFIPRALELFDEVIYVDVPKERRFMHPDMIYNRINPNLSLVYLPAILKAYHITREERTEIDFEGFMNSREIELINISDEEQRRWGCSFVPLEPNTFFHYELALSTQTRKKLEQRGVQIIDFNASSLFFDGGSLRCHTLRLLRE
ncbi:MAG: N-dimethylarginine dimethylaminohydrolase [Clostridiales bacterium]|nr:N-dimethylarginine dimethylaminohydrolase [Clostridiales bacterium]